MWPGQCRLLPSCRISSSPSRCRPHKVTGSSGEPWWWKGAVVVLVLVVVLVVVVVMVAGGGRGWWCSRWVGGWVGGGGGGATFEICFTFHHSCERHETSSVRMMKGLTRNPPEPPSVLTADEPEAVRDPCQITCGMEWHRCTKQERLFGALGDVCEKDQAVPSRAKSCQAVSSHAERCQAMSSRAKARQDALAPFLSAMRRYSRSFALRSSPTTWSTSSSSRGASPCGGMSPKRAR